MKVKRDRSSSICSLQWNCGYIKSNIDLLKQHFPGHKCHILIYLLQLLNPDWKIILRLCWFLVLSSCLLMYFTFLGGANFIDLNYERKTQ